MKLRRKNLTAAAALAAIIAQSCSLSAADLLRRGSASSGGGSQAAGGEGDAGGALREQTLINNREALARANRTLRDINRMQTEARAAALTRASTVPDGLGAGGLQVAPGATTPGSTLWRGANLPVQTVAGGRTQVGIKQTTSQAFLTWQSFNIGKNTDLVFDQSAGGADRAKWIAFNQINDPTESPSRILGSIRADGQVYVINRNGVIFDGSSQVNVRGLTVSSLPLNTNLAAAGLLNNPDAQFLFTGLPIAAGPNGTPAFTPEAPPISTNRYGNIVIEAGAIFESPQTNEGGGRITLVGPNVSNAGTIRTPGGQTILAAGLQVGFAAHSSSDATLRGLDTYVGRLAPAGTPAEDIYTGNVTNSGLIEVMRGSTTLAGRNLTVSGAIDSSTSVALNGRIDLRASYGAVANTAAASSAGQLPFNFSESGQVALGADALLRILPEDDTKTKITASALALRSQLNLQGRTIHLGENSTILAPSAAVNLDAGVWRASSPTPSTSFVNADGQIYLDRNALISVAGSAGVQVPVGQNIIAVELRGSELADSPLQRNSFLRGQTIYVDIRNTGTFNGTDWVGTPLADVTGYLGLIERTVGELTTTAGQVNLRAGGSIVLRESSLVDVSAGWIDYQGGEVRTTRLFQNGRLVDIADARPDVSYDSIYTGTTTVTSERWGVSTEYIHPIQAFGSRFEDGYSQGAAGGAVTLVAESMALDGAFVGRTTPGTRQREDLPTPSALTLDFTSRRPNGTDAPPAVTANPPAVVFTETPSQDAPDEFALDADGNPQELPSGRVARVEISTGVFTDSGLGKLVINNPEGDVTLPMGLNLEGPVGGTVELRGSNVNIGGSILMPAGNISLVATNVPLDTAIDLEFGASLDNPDPFPGRGVVSVGADARLSTAGLIVNDLFVTDTLPSAARNAGNISVTGFSVLLASGSQLDVSGGYQLDSEGELNDGDAGGITINAGRDPRINSVIGGTLALNGELRGLADAGAQAGSLSILAPRVTVGATTKSVGALNLDTGFFNQGGFGSFTIGGIGAETTAPDVFIPGVLIASGARIAPRVESQFATINTDVEDGLIIDRRVEPLGVRPAADLTFRATGAQNTFAGQLIVRGEVVLEAGAEIVTEAGGDVRLAGQSVDVAGNITAPGGVITIAGASSYQSLSPETQRALPTVMLGANSRLDVSGEVVLLPDAFGLRTGTVFAGGAVTVSGNVLAKEGAVIAASGTSGVLDFTPNYGDGRTTGGALLAARTVPVNVVSSGGSITLDGAQLLASDATLVARSGGEGAGGGSLTVSSGRFYRDNETTSTADRNLTVIQSGNTFEGAGSGLGLAVITDEGAPLDGGGRFAVNRFQQGGFDDLTLGGNVLFSGPIEITTRGSLRVSPDGVVQANDWVTLNAGYASLGRDFVAPQDPSQQPFLFTQTVPGIGLREFNFTPEHGTGSLLVNADHIDLGTLSAQGIGLTRFTATGGDIRGNGFVNVAGELQLAAGQVYPTTGSTFTLTAFDYTPAGGSLTEGMIRISNAGGRPDLPSSAAGTLNLFASQIEQNGTLRAPFGVINLGRESGSAGPRNGISGTNAAATRRLELGSQSLTSVSAFNKNGTAVTLPYGIIVNGTTWIDPRGVDITLGGLPEKAVNLGSTDIVTEEGSIVDVRGGGDLLAYRFIPGTGGSRDVLSVDGAFAVIPGDQSVVAPYAAFNPTPVDDSLGGDGGYTNANLTVGDQVRLAASAGLPAGTYTLLPSRYALLPGAFLVTPVSAPPLSTTALPDGSSLVSGYRVNGLTGALEQGGVSAGFEVASRKVVQERAEYSLGLANSFLRDAAASRGGVTPRLPIDSGRLVINAGGTLEVVGSVEATPQAGGRGSEVDISSPLDIIISGPGAVATPGALTLDAAGLSRFGAASLLVGGLRTSTREGSLITTTAQNLTVDNAGTPLTGSDIILVARENLTLAEGATVRASSSGTANAATALTLGSKDTVGSGDGTLLRVVSATAAPVARAGVSVSTDPQLVIEDNARLSGGTVLIDSSSGTAISENTIITAGSLGLNSGRISLVLDEVADTSGAGGLVLSGAALDNALASAESLSLLSYSSIDLFGSGTVGSADFQSLSLTAPALRRFGSGNVVFAAADIRVNNTTLRAASAPLAAPSSGNLVFNADSLVIGEGQLAVQGFDRVALNASSEIRLSSTGGLSVTGDLELITPVVVAATGATQTLDADGDIRLLSPASSGSAVVSGLGGFLTLRGDTVTLDSVINLPSGRVDARAREGDLVVGGVLNVAGTSQRFFDQTRVTSGGSILLSATQGSVNLQSGAELDLSAPSVVGQAGTLEVLSPLGSFTADGVIRAAGVKQGGAFVLDTGALANTTLLDGLLDEAGFDYSRLYRVRTGDVEVAGSARVREYRLSADGGDVLVTGDIDASGATGGDIALRASGNLTLADGARLDVSGTRFSSAGKGGLVELEAGAQIAGVVSPTARLSLETGSVIDLSVAASDGDDALYGRNTGALRLRAPRTDAGTDLRLDAIGATIIDPSYVSVEGYKLYDLTATAGVITSAIQTQVRNEAQTFLGAAGATTADFTAMRDRLLALQPDLGDSLVLRPGAEIIHRTGDLVLGTTSSTATSDWNLATFRFGPDSAPGVLTLRAAGDLVFHNALSDGFAGGSSLWLSPLMAFNAALPTNLQTWDYRLTAGADLVAADYREVLPESQLTSGKGSLLIGKNTGAANVGAGGPNVLTATLIANNYQVIRTGSGDIDISSGRDIRLQNPFAAIYTAGTKVPNATSIFSANDFVLPVTVSALQQGSLGSAPQNSVAQYAFAGGDVRLSAQGNIERVTRNSLGATIADSSRQLPNNWLYRRSTVGTDGNFATVRLNINAFSSFTDASASTTWWVDYTNFFQSVGALGGGNVTMHAGANISNVDAVIPTNARMPSGTPDATKLVELGGGDLDVRAGNNIDAGVYYVQRGEGTLHADGAITTNATRSLNLGILSSLNNPVRLPESTWMPTTLFVGDATFNVSARGDVLLGPVANPHLLPQGNGNRYWYKTYFSTYGENAGVETSSLVGEVMMRNSVTLPDTLSSRPFLQAWMSSQNLFAGVGSTGAAFFQPWLRLAEASVEPFGELVTVQPPNLRATAFTGSISLAGNFNLFPSPTGQLELLSADSIHALTQVGESNLLIAGRTVAAWQASRINLSDASPANLPGITNPFSYYASTGFSNAAPQNNTTRIGFLASVNSSFNETGATNTVLQTQQALHDSGLLHRDDNEPLRIFAAGGDLSGLTLFSAKPVVVSAERDLSDIAFYIQNNRADQVSVVSAGRDFTAFAPNSDLRVVARSDGNALNNGQQPLPGDIQISGPGTLEVLAGRNLDLGIGNPNTDGTAAGITSVGNVRNPALPQAGADIFVAAGLGQALDLGDADAAYDGFAAAFLDPAAGALAARYLPELGKLIGMADADNEAVWTAYNNFPSGVRARITLAMFNRVLRDAGREFNNPESDTFGTYKNALAAIDALFPGQAWDGDISLTSRQIKTAAGGDISIFAPGGQLTVGLPGAAQRPDQGVLTEAGGDIAIYTQDSVNVGTSRIFTLRGGDIQIWSTRGDIAAGSASKTVRSAPPTRVLIDPQSASVETDLSGLATGGGIGVLQTVADVAAGNVDLIAPEGVIDAGDAGIRSSGNLNLAAASVLNAANIQTGGSTAGAPAAAPSLNIGSLSSANSTAVAAGGGGLDSNRSGAAAASAAADRLPSIFNVEVIGYGGGGEDDDDDKRAKPAADATLSQDKSAAPDVVPGTVIASHP